MTRPAIPEDRRIHLRWLRWEPFCILHLRRTAIRDQKSALANLRKEHASRWRYSRENGIPETTIASSSLDNPMVPIENIRVSVDQAVERRCARMGRVKGQSIRHLSLEQRRAKFIADAAERTQPVIH
jgi:hypothetical protein